MEEVWKPIPGYEGLYEISSFGKVENVRGKSRKQLAFYTNPNSEYLNVTLWKEGKKKSFRVNRLVALTFLPNPNNYPQVNHKDENKTNNCVDNLEWCTAKYNNNYGNRIKKASRAVLAILPNVTVEYYISIAEAGRILGTSAANISGVLAKKRKTAKGRAWMYATEEANKC